MHLGRVITSPRCTVGRVNPSSSAFYQSKGRVDGSLDEPMHRTSRRSFVGLKLCTALARISDLQTATSVWSITCQFGAFLFGARQFDACQFGALHFDAVPVRRVSVWRDASLARCQFGAFPIFVSMLIQYSRQFSFFSAKASLARVYRIYLCASLPRSHSTRTIIFCVFFLPLCVIGLQHSKLVYRRCILCLVHTFINQEYPLRRRLVPLPDFTISAFTYTIARI